MVKLTIIGRVSDGLPLAKGPRYVHEENEIFTTYKQQGEFILKEISRGDLISSSKMTIRVDHHCFRIMVANGVCFMALCDSSYPRKLAFLYLQDLQQEFDKLDRRQMERVVNPYSFLKLDTIIGNIRRQYVDTRTQANISRLKTGIGEKDLDVIAEDLPEIVNRRRRLDMLETMMAANLSDSPIWGSKKLETIALKWTPVTILVVVTVVLLWSSSVHREEFQ
ncbi:PREDICTED: 25.3 kDa vesicle transport protein [Ipomoea nil]|uniref:25.3 kDa vesicle transport protein n=1 Tax=Ipomoea nil TaxID=35883 RepID=UPI000901B495|nr:PREDICTED: 25.3 kDa vesicle transport protein [Ipomoea nil]XP_019194997.1 PREDICTED: 25.3 kDa vesicle transport protein [Ipomoea nil]